MSLEVRYTPRAVSQLEALYQYIAADSGRRRAKPFVDSIFDYCDGLSVFPHRGSRRDDLRPGLRIIGFRRRVAIAFTVDAAGIVILGVFYGGQDYEQILRSDDGDSN